MISKHGAPLMNEAARMAVRDLLLPRATLVTPNLFEAAELAGMSVATRAQMMTAAEGIAKLGAEAVLVKGGHLDSEPLDLLFRNGVFTEYRGPRIETRHTHGTGCTYSSAITAFLARGLTLAEAIARAKAFITEAIRTAPGLGSGSGPVNHWAAAPDPL